MPYLILTSQAKLVNTYVCGPIVVGDKNADQKLMKAIGAKLVNNYPACGSPPLFLVYGHPRAVLEKLEDVGFTLVDTSVAGDCRECILWTLYSPGGFADPNSKAIQTSDSEMSGSISSSQRSRSSRDSGRRSSSKKTPATPLSEEGGEELEEEKVLSPPE